MNALTNGGNREAATLELEQQMLVARVLGGSCARDFKHFKVFRGFEAGKRQA